MFSLYVMAKRRGGHFLCLLLLCVWGLVVSAPAGNGAGLYGAHTTIAPEKSRGEIEAMLARYGADGFSYANDQRTRRSTIVFRAHNRFVKFSLQLPGEEDFAKTGGGRRRNVERLVRAAHEQAIRQRWRALVLVIRAKLESVASGIETFEDAFLANIMLPDGGTFGGWAGPEIDKAYKLGTMPGSLMMAEHAGDGSSS